MIIYFLKYLCTDSELPSYNSVQYDLITMDCDYLSNYDLNENDPFIENSQCFSMNETSNLISNSPEKTECRKNNDEGNNHTCSSLDSVEKEKISKNTNVFNFRQPPNISVTKLKDNIDNKNINSESTVTNGKHQDNPSCLLFQQDQIQFIDIKDYFYSINQEKYVVSQILDRYPDLCIESDNISNTNVSVSDSQNLFEDIGAKENNSESKSPSLLREALGKDIIEEKKKDNKNNYMKVTNFYSCQKSKLRSFNAFSKEKQLQDNNLNIGKQNNTKINFKNYIYLNQNKQKRNFVNPCQNESFNPNHFNNLTAKDMNTKKKEKNSQSTKFNDLNIIVRRNEKMNFIIEKVIENQLVRNRNSRPYFIFSNNENI